MARDKILEAFKTELEPDDVRSTSMGASGPDLLFSPAARRLFPFDVEVKAVEKLNIWQAIEQARGHGQNTPMVCFTKNSEKMFVALPMDKFLEIYKKALNEKDNS
jgi:hypothetical protein